MADELREELERQEEQRLYGLAFALLTEDELRAWVGASDKMGTRQEPNPDFDEADLTPDEVAALEKVDDLVELGEEELNHRVEERRDKRP